MHGIGKCSECSYVGALYNEACPKHANYEKGENMNDETNNQKMAKAVFSSNHFYPPTKGNPLIEDDKMNNSKNGCGILVGLLIGMALLLTWAGVNLYNAMKYPLEEGHIVLFNHNIIEFACEDLGHFRANPEMYTVGPLAKDPEGAVKEIERVAKIACPTDGGSGWSKHIHFIVLDGYGAWQMQAVQNMIEFGKVEKGYATYDAVEIANHIDNTCDGNFFVRSH